MQPFVHSLTSSSNQYNGCVTVCPVIGLPVGLWVMMTLPIVGPPVADHYKDRKSEHSVYPEGLPVVQLN